MTPTDAAAQVLSKSGAAKRISIHSSNGYRDYLRLRKLLKTSGKTLAENRAQNESTADSVARNAVVFSAQAFGANRSVYTETQFLKGNDYIRTEVAVIDGSCGEASEYLT